jgi:hypothetical protein
VFASPVPRPQREGAVSAWGIPPERTAASSPLASASGQEPEDVQLRAASRCCAAFDAPAQPLRVPWPHAPRNPVRPT